jgi:hypothetical protein
MPIQPRVFNCQGFKIECYPRIVLICQDGHLLAVTSDPAGATQWIHEEIEARSALSPSTDMQSFLSS